MNRLRSLWLMFAAAIALLAMVIPAGSTKALAEEPPFDSYPAGQACAFELGYRYENEGNRIEHAFYDKDGNLIRLLSTGKGGDLTLKNMATGATLTLKGKGANQDIRFNPDGTVRLTSTGHNVVILFPSDTPAGPSTTLYSGRVVITIDTDGNWTVIEASGKRTDICAALSS